MRIFLFLFILVCSGFSAPSYAAIESLTVDLADDHVDITTGFHGSRLVLFGTKKSKGGDIVVIVRGPYKNMAVRKKNRILGAWMNTEYLNFKNIPGFYDFAVSDHITERVRVDVLTKNGVGLPALMFKPAKRDGYKDEEVAEFEKALIRNKQKEHLFPEQPKKIKMLNDHFFRTELYIPANVPKGEYEIETQVYVKGHLAEKSLTELRVAQIGMSAAVFDFSKTNGLAYGMICVFIAVFAGWGVNLFRRAT